MEACVVVCDFSSSGNKRFCVFRCYLICLVMYSVAHVFTSLGKSRAHINVAYGDESASPSKQPRKDKDHHAFRESLLAVWIGK